MDPTTHLNLAERRRHARKNLRVQAHIFRGPDVIRITTRNISIGGFYSVCEERFVCGEQFDSLLEIAGLVRPAQIGAHLECTVRVVRVEPDGEFDDGVPERFGVAFRIESYRVATSASGGEF